MLLLQANCTVTIAHSRTRDLPDVVRRADIVVAAVGRPELVRGDWLKPGATVIDVGINRVDQRRTATRKLLGDVDFDAASEVAGAITPVPGGVGPMTIACLMRNTLVAAAPPRGPRGAGGLMITALLCMAADRRMTAIDAERAFAADAQKVGQWTAFRKYATDDAVMFVPAAGQCADLLKDKKDPPVVGLLVAGAQLRQLRRQTGRQHRALGSPVGQVGRLFHDCLAAPSRRQLEMDLRRTATS